MHCLLFFTEFIRVVVINAEILYKTISFSEFEHRRSLSSISFPENFSSAWKLSVMFKDKITIPFIS